MDLITRENLDDLLCAVLSMCYFTDCGLGALGGVLVGLGEVLQMLVSRQSCDSQSQPWFFIYKERDQ